jgi:Protein of unknown function (DUF2846)
MKIIKAAACAAMLYGGASVPALAADVTEPIAIPSPPPGKGQIVFFRSSTIVGAALGCSVNENGQKVSSLGRGRYFIMVTEPGRHEFTVKSEAKDVLALEVEPDETQYSSCKIKMGIMVGRPDIRPASEAEFRAQKNLKLVDADDMGPGPGALRPEDVAAALAGPPTAADEPASAEPTEDAAPADEPAPPEESAPAEPAS